MRTVDSSLSVWRNAVFEHIHDPMLVLDAQGILLDLNPSAMKALCLDRQIALQKPLSELLPQNPTVAVAFDPRQPQVGFITIAAGAADPHVYEWFTTALEAPDEGPGYTLLQLHAMTAHTPRAECLCVARNGSGEEVQDGNSRRVDTPSEIAARTEAEAQNAELLARLALATRVASLGVWELELSTNVLTWDDQMFETYGVPKTTLLSKASWAALVHPDDLQAAESAERAVIENKTQGTLIFRIIRPDGVTRTIYAAEGVVMDEQGTVTRVIGANLDITERKRTEEALEKSQALLNETNRIAKIGGWELDIKTGNQVWTEEVYRIHEVDMTYQPTASKGIAFYAPASRPAIERAVQRAIEYGEPFDVELEFITATGQQRWVHSIGKADQAHARVYGTIHDVTDRKRQEQEIRRLNSTLEQQVHERTAELAAAVEDLKRAAKMKDEFMAAVSHELRTPLTGILGMAEALEMQFSGELNDRQAHYVRNIHQSGERLLAMINSILRYTSLMAGNVKLQQEPCRLTELCAIAVSAVRDLAEQKGQTVAWSVEPAGIAIVSDADCILQTIQQLLDNAVKFTPAGGHIGLEVQVDADEDNVHLVVWDTGIGIAPDQQATIFQPFVQGDSSLTRHFGGMGLGLAYVRRTVELLDGTIALESTPGEGSRFTVTLPVLPV